MHRQRDCLDRSRLQSDELLDSPIKAKKCRTHVNSRRKLGHLFLYPCYGLCHLQTKAGVGKCVQLRVEHRPLANSTGMARKRCSAAPLVTLRCTCGCRTQELAPRISVLSVPPTYGAKPEPRQLGTATINSPGTNSERIALADGTATGRAGFPGEDDQFPGTGSLSIAGVALLLRWAVEAVLELHGSNPLRIPVICASRAFGAQCLLFPVRVCGQICFEVQSLRTLEPAATRSR